MIGFGKRGGLARQIILLNILAILLVSAAFLITYTYKTRELAFNELQSRAKREAILMADKIGTIFSDPLQNADMIDKNIADVLKNYVIKESSFDENLTRPDGQNHTNETSRFKTIVYVAAYRYDSRTQKYHKIASVGDENSPLFEILSDFDTRKPDMPIGMLVNNDFLHREGLVAGHDDAYFTGFSFNTAKRAGRIDVILSDKIMRDQMNTAILHGTIVAVLAAFFSITMVVVVVHSILRHVKPVIHAADRIAKGEMWLDTLDTEANNELGQLAESFNLMLAGLQRVVEEIRAISEGDLTRIQTAELPGQLGSALRVMGKDLDNMVQEIKNIASLIASASEQIRLITQRAAHDVQKQASDARAMAQTVESVAAAVAEIARNGRMVAENAQAAMSTSIIAADAAREGGSVVEETIQRMQEIGESVQFSSDNISQLSRQTNKIGTLVDMISSIAEMSNMLALNAAIEAASAGEHGKGFVVVADKVRKLADRTTDATRDVSTMVTDIQFKTEQVVQDMKRWKAEVGEGVEKNDKAIRALEDIVNRNRELQEKVQQISLAIEEQTNATDEMSDNLAQISSTLEKSATLAQELAIGSEQVQISVTDLATQAENLVHSVERFKT